MTELLRADSYAYESGHRSILKSASVALEAGKVTALFGRNGSGKSTLIRCMLGLMRADSGTTWHQNRILERPRIYDLARRGVFYLPDRGLLPRSQRFCSAIRAVEQSFGVSPEREVILDRLTVRGFLDRRAGQLSGGEQRRCEWALALLRGPECVIADEPLLGCMPADQELLSRLMRDLALDGKAVLVTGHEFDTLSRVGDRLVWISGGSTLELGSLDEARRHAGFCREYLGVDALAD